MSKLIGIGELIIDFSSVGTSKLKDTKQFVKNPGGAPANVCVQVAKNGHNAVYASKVGNDGFGEFLIESLKNMMLKSVTVVTGFEPFRFVVMKGNGYLFDKTPKVSDLIENALP